MNLRFTSKQLRNFIKNGHTPESLCERYHCTEEELKKFIERLYHQDKSGEIAHELFSELVANRKIARKKTVASAPEINQTGSDMEDNESAPVEPEKGSWGGGRYYPGRA